MSIVKKLKLLLARNYTKSIQKAGDNAVQIMNIPKSELLKVGDNAIAKHDDRGNCIYFKDDTIEYWKEYDYSNRLVHYKDSTGYESYYEYKDSENSIHFRDSRGYEYYDKYDTHGNLIKHKKVD